MRTKLGLLILPTLVAVGAATYWHFYLRTLESSPPPPGDPQASLSLSAALEGAPAEVAPQPTPYDLSDHQTLSRVTVLIKDYYVERERIDPYHMFLAALDHIQRSVAEVIVDDSEAPNRITVKVGGADRTFEMRLTDMDKLWEVTMGLRDIFRYLQQHIEDPEQRRNIEYAAINGMLSTLDPHSVLLRPESFNEVKLSTRGEFGGLGIVISIREGALTIISPISGTPAFRAGLKAKDKIVKIGEESTVNMSLEEAVERLRGKPGTEITIWVKRKQWVDARPFVLTRAIIKIESVAHELLSDGVGYIRIKSFQANTYDDLHAQLEELRKKNKAELRGLVLDLRNNPGGLLDQAILVSDRFIDKGPLVITVGEGDKRRDVKQAHVGGTEPDYPIAVLVNGGSASASEIVSGALKNHDRAVVIGQQTFGKGSVQVLYDFDDSSALKLTIAQYLTPGDISIQSVGIQPDIEIAPAAVTKEGLQLFSSDSGLREEDLDNHLGRFARREETPAMPPPAFRITHISEEEEDAEDSAANPEEGDSATSATSTGDEFKYDFEIGVAHRLVTKAQTSKRRGMIDGGRAELEQARQKEEERITQRLKELGADWTAGALPPNPRLELSLEASPAQVEPGKELVLTAKAKNVGTQPLYQVYAVSSSSNYLYKNREFVFGHLAPGEMRQWVVKVKTPQDAVPEANLLELGALARSPGAPAVIAASVQAVVQVLARPLPSFSFRYLMDDASRGNGDGVAQVGEDIQLVVDVSNASAVDSEDVVVTLKNLSETAVFLDSGRAKIGALKAQEHKRATLTFAVREPVEAVALRVSLWDNIVGEAISDRVHVPVEAARTIRATKQLVRADTTAVEIRGGAWATAPVLGSLPQGGVLRSGSVITHSAGHAWHRLEDDAGVLGYVRQETVSAQGASKQKPTAWHHSLGTAAPRLVLRADETVTFGQTVMVRGTVEDENPIRDFFVFVNDRKVHYQRLEDIPLKDGTARWAFELKVPLKEGSNTISAVARENTDLQSRRVLGVLRRSVSKAGVVAEQSTK